jgi:hypothetical protein
MSKCNHLGVRSGLGVICVLCGITIGPILSGDYELAQDAAQAVASIFDRTASAETSSIAIVQTTGGGAAITGSGTLVSGPASVTGIGVISGGTLEST